MALYFIGIVNPSSPEIAAGIAMWTHGVALDPRRRWRRSAPRPKVRDRGVRPVCRRARSRRLWLFFALVVLVIVAGRPRVEELVRRRVVQVWAGAVIAVALIQTVWSAIAKPLSEGNTAQKGLDEGLTLILRQSVGKSYWSNTREMIGMFGWLDTNVPMGRS